MYLRATFSLSVYAVEEEPSHLKEALTSWMTFPGETWKQNAEYICPPGIFGLNPSTIKESYPFYPPIYWLIKLPLC